MHDPRGMFALGIQIEINFRVAKLSISSDQIAFLK